MKHVTIGGRRLTWRLRERMEAVGVRSARELHRRLRATDPESIGFSRLAEMIDAMPARISARTLLGLTLVLDCDVDQIMAVEHHEGS